MDASTLESLIRNLEIRSDSLDEELSIWIALVVIGLFVEIAVILAEYVEKHKAHRSGTIRSPEKPTVSGLLFHLAGATLIAIGVAGEFAIHLRSGKVNADLRNANGQLVALLNKEAGLARKGAEEAKRDAGTFSAKIAEANATSDAAKKDAAEANLLAKKYEGEIATAKKDAAESNARAAEALKVAEQERLARARIEASLARRRIDEGQRKPSVDI